MCIFQLWRPIMSYKDLPKPENNSIEKPIYVIDDENWGWNHLICLNNLQFIESIITLNYIVVTQDLQAECVLLMLRGSGQQSAGRILVKMVPAECSLFSVIWRMWWLVTPPPSTFPVLYLSSLFRCKYQSASWVFSKILDAVPNCSFLASLSYKTVYKPVFW